DDFSHRCGSFLPGARVASGQGRPAAGLVRLPIPSRDRGFASMKFPSFLRMFGKRGQARGSSSRRRHLAGPRRSPRPNVEVLEDRWMPAGLPTVANNGFVQIGTAGSTNLNPSISQNSPSISINPVNPQQLVSVSSLGVANTTSTIDLNFSG